MSEMVERVARALGEIDRGNHSGLPDYAAMARAAIEALREPTTMMLIAARRDGRYSDLDFHDLQQICRLMIDEALK